jgi:type 1 fimbriae regulatory protein FimB
MRILTSKTKPEKSRAYKRGDVQYLDEDELARLFAVIQSAGDAMHLAIFQVALHRGLRASEVGMLQFARLRLGARTLFIERLKNGISGEYLLTDPELRSLRRWIAIRGSAAGPIFRSRRGGPISRQRLDQLMKLYGAAAAIPSEKRHFHCLRHTAGTLRGEQGELIEVQDLLGHRDPRSTLIYLRMRDKRRKQVGERWRSGLV